MAPWLTSCKLLRSGQLGTWRHDQCLWPALRKWSPVHEYTHTSRSSSTLHARPRWLPWC